MGYIAKLRRGTNYIDLSGTNYRLGLDFVPPTVSEVPEFSQGTSANVYGGGSLVGRTAQNASLSFSLHIFGDSTAQIKQLADNLANFLRGAGDDSNPTYFWWNPDNDVTYEPHWGQSWRALEVVSGQIDYSMLYSSMGASTGRALPNCFVTLMCKPFALGIRQRVATATGALRQDVLGSPDGTSRGLMVTAAFANTNYFPNPSFEYSTYSQNWTVTNAELVASLVTDKRFVAVGNNAVELTNTSATSAHAWVDSIDLAEVSSYLISFFVKKRDGSAVTSDDCVVYYAAAVTTNFIPMGDGWYWAWGTFTSEAAARNCGVLVRLGKAVVVDGFCMLETTLPRPYIDGDQIGCAWSGTAHNSTSTVTAGTVKVPWADIVASRAQGTFVAVITPWLTTGQMPDDDRRLFMGAFLAYYDKSAAAMKFSDGTNTAGSDNNCTFVVRTPMVIHATYSSSGLAIYVNGTAAGTNATYTPPAAATHIYLNTSDSATLPPFWTLNDFWTYPRAMSASEVTAQAANLLAAARGGDGYGKCVSGGIPFLWTKDGDDVVDQYNDATHDNFCIVGGVPGSADAETEIVFTSSAALENDVAGGIVASRFEIPYNATLDTTDLFGDLSGTADVYAVGGEVTRTSTDTSADSVTSTLVLTDNTMRLLKNRQFYLLVNVADAGANLMGEVFAITGGGATVSNGGYINVPPAEMAGLSRNVLLGPISLPNATYLNPTYNIEGSIGIHWKRSTGSASNVDTDFVQLMPFPVLTISLHDTGNYEVTFLYFSTKKTYATAATTLNEYVTTSGKLEFAPGQYNYVFSCIGDVKMTSIVNTAITETLTYTSVYITPRWALL